MDHDGSVDQGSYKLLEFLDLLLGGLPYVLLKPSVEERDPREPDALVNEAVTLGDLLDIGVVCQPGSLGGSVTGDPYPKEPGHISFNACLVLGSNLVNKVLTQLLILLSI